MQLFYVLRRTARRARRAVGGDINYRVYLLAGILTVLFLLHIGAMMVFEELSPGDAAWLTITTATTVGYGDMSAVTPAGRWATVLLMYVGGIFVLAQLAGLIFESAQDRLERRRKGLIAIDATDHVVIFGWREDYLRRMVWEIRGSISDLREREIVIVSPNLEMLPEDFIQNNVLHVYGRLFDDNTLTRANVSRAARIGILPEAGNEETVHTNLELIARLHDQTESSLIYAAQNRNALLLAEDLGANDALIFDVNYPEIFARAIITVGGEDVLDELIDRDGIEMIIIHLPLRATIAEIISSSREHATLLGMRSTDGTYDLHPHPELTVTDQRLIFLADIDRFGSEAAAREAIEDSIGHLKSDGVVERFNYPKDVGVIGSARRATESFLKKLEESLEHQRVSYLGAGALSVGGQWKVDELTTLDAVVVLSNNPTEPASDAKTYLLIRQLRQSLGYEGRIIAEALLPESRERFLAIGASDILRPVVRNVDILARCIATGAEEILDNLYGSGGDSELIAVPTRIEETWRRFCEKNHALGLPVAFENDTGKHIVPTPDFVGGAGTLFILVDKERCADIRALRKGLSAYIKG